MQHTIFAQNFLLLVVTKFLDVELSIAVARGFGVPPRTWMTQLMSLKNILIMGQAGKEICLVESSLEEEGWNRLMTGSFPWITYDTYIRGMLSSCVTVRIQ